MLGRNDITSPCALRNDIVVCLVLCPVLRRVRICLMMLPHISTAIRGSKSCGRPPASARRRRGSALRAAGAARLRVLQRRLLLLVPPVQVGRNSFAPGDTNQA